MISKLKNRFPDLKISTQKKHVHERYSISIKIKFSFAPRLVSALRRPNDSDSLWFYSSTSTDQANWQPSTSCMLMLGRKILDNKIAFRHEHQTIIMYFDDLDAASEMIDMILSFEAVMPDLIEKISAVPDHLNIGEVAVGTNLSAYKFKVLLKDFEARNHQPFLQMLETNKHHLKLTGRLANVINKKDQDLNWGTNYIFNNYLYSNNEELITFLSLSASGLIKKIYRVTDTVK
jgi:hypothetical protein